MKIKVYTTYWIDGHNISLLALDSALSSYKGVLLTSFFTKIILY